MKEIDQIESLLESLEGRLAAECRDLREALDSCFDQNPAEALETTQSLSEVFRKQGILKEKGEILKEGLEALREMNRLRGILIEKAQELGPQYAIYRKVRHLLHPQGDQELTGLLQEIDEDFQLDYPTLEGGDIEPYRFLAPSSFEAADEFPLPGASAPPIPEPLAPVAPPPEETVRLQGDDFVAESGEAFELPVPSEPPPRPEVAAEASVAAAALALSQSPPASPLEEASTVLDLDPSPEALGAGGSMAVAETLGLVPEELDSDVTEVAPMASVHDLLESGAEIPVIRPEETTSLIRDTSSEVEALARELDSMDEDAVGLLGDVFDSEVDADTRSSIQSLIQDAPDDELDVPTFDGTPGGHILDRTPGQDSSSLMAALDADLEDPSEVTLDAVPVGFPEGSPAMDLGPGFSEPTPDESAGEEAANLLAALEDDFEDDFSGADLEALNPPEAKPMPGLSGSGLPELPPLGPGPQSEEDPFGEAPVPPPAPAEEEDPFAEFGLDLGDSPEPLGGRRGDPLDDF